VTYAVFFAWGVDRAFATVTPLRLVGGAVALALPLLSCPTIVGGLNDQVRSSHVPASFAHAADLVAARSGKVLVLPWHQYLAFPFTPGVIANPGARVFGDVISGDNVELPGLPSTSTSTRSAYLQAALARGAANTAFGATVAPLGVDYVALFKTVDFRSYAWLGSQPDLSVVMDTAEILVLRNDSPLRGVISASSTVGGVTPAQAAAQPELLARGAVPLVGEAVAVAAGTVEVRRESLTSFRARTGGAALLLLQEAWSPRWHVEGGSAAGQTSWGTVAVAVDRTHNRVSFARSTTGAACLAGTLLVVLAGGLAECVRRRGDVPRISRIVVASS
jgi:hypothetical protein